MRSILAITCGALAALGALSAAEGQTVVPLYPGAAPGSEAWKHREEEKDKPGVGRIVVHVAKPTLTVFQPVADKANGTSIVICPGGGFRLLSIDNEGLDVARFLAAKGVTCFVLKYRTMPPDDVKANYGAVMKMAGADGLAAVRFVRAHASEYQLNPERIGILGFSAGGWVATGVSINYKPDSRPAFVAPIYGTYDILAGGGKVREDAPPLFLAAAQDDPLHTAVGSEALQRAWVAAGKSAELHVYPSGGHGFGMRKQNQPSDAWPDEFAAWLLKLGLLKG